MKMRIKNSTYKYPVKMFNNVDLPAPLGPIIAVNSPDLNSPDTPFSTVFCTVIFENWNEKKSKLKNEKLFRKPKVVSRRINFN